MSAHPKARMTVDEFLAWADGRPGRYELLDGEIFGMSPQRAGHTRTKFRVQNALDQAIRAAGLPCEMLPDGMTVQLDNATAYEPDALVQCGERLPDDAVQASQPIIVVEVLSPSTGRIDTGQKLDGYFRVPSVMHYLIVNPIRSLIIHHRRGVDDVIETRIISSGTLDLTPPGLTFSVADVFHRP